MRTRPTLLASLACATALLSACGSSSEPPPASTSPATGVPAATSPTPGTASAAATAPATAGGAKPPGAGAGASTPLSRKTFARRADRICARSTRGAQPWARRLKALVAELPRRRGEAVRDAGYLFAQATDKSENEHEALLALGLPEGERANHRARTFLGWNEEGILLVEQIGSLMRTRDDRDSFVRSVRRLERVAASYRSAARSLGMKVCGTTRARAR